MQQMNFFFTKRIKIGDYEVKLVHKLAEGGFSYVYLVSFLKGPAVHVDLLLTELGKRLSTEQYEKVVQMVQEHQKIDKNPTGALFSKLRLFLQGTISIQFLKSFFLQKGDLLALKEVKTHSSEELTTIYNELHYYATLKSPFLIQSIASTTAKTSIISSTPHHENGVSIDEINFVYCLFPYYKHGTLYDHISAPTYVYNEANCLQLMIGWAKGIETLHAQQLRHADIKPGNLILEELDLRCTNEQLCTSHPIVIDLGSVCSAKCRITTKTQAILLQEKAERESSAPFRAPELYTVQVNDVVDAKADIWSLGCSLYCMIYGPYGPFESQVEGLLKLNILNAKVKYPDTPMISEKLKELMVQMLQLNPVDRPTIKEVVEKLEEIVEGNDFPSFANFSDLTSIDNCENETAKCSKCGVFIVRTVDEIEKHSNICFS